MPAASCTADVRFDLVGPAAERRARDRAGRHVADALAQGRRPGWQIVEWTRSTRRPSRAPTGRSSREITAAALGGTEAFRRQLNTPLDAWMTHARRRADPRLERTPRRLGRRRRRRRPRRSLRRAAGRPAQPAVPRPRRRHLRGRRPIAPASASSTTPRSRCSPTSTTTAIRIWSWPPARSRCCSSTTARAASRRSPAPSASTRRCRACSPACRWPTTIATASSTSISASTPTSSAPARRRPARRCRTTTPATARRASCSATTARAASSTPPKATGLDAGNDRYHFAAAWADYDEDGWPDLLVANDFGVKNLYRNLGARGGAVRFEDVAEQAGVLDYGAGMSAAFLDYDNDGRLDIYTGNMWTAHGLRVTASPAFMPERPRRGARPLPPARARQRRCIATSATAASRTRRSRPAPTWAAGPGHPTRSTSTATAGDDLYVANGMLTRADPDLDGFFWRQVVAQSPLTPVKGTPYDEAWRAINQLLIHHSIASRQRNVLLRNDGKGGFDDVSGTAGLDLDQDGRSFAVLDARSRRRSGSRHHGGAAGAAAAHLPQRHRRARPWFSAAADRFGQEQPRRDRRPRRGRDRAAEEDEASCRRARASCRSTRRR